MRININNNLRTFFPEQTPYHYAFNSPLIWKDPSGLKSEKEGRDKMMGMETLLLQIANFFVDVTRNMVDNSNKNCKCSDTWACPCANDDKGGGRGGGGGQSFLGFSLPKADNPMQSAMKAGNDNGTGYSSKIMITSKADKNISVRNGLSISIALSALALNGELFVSELALSATTALSFTVALPVSFFAGYVVFNIIESSKYPKSKVDQIFNCHTGPTNPMFDPDDDNLNKFEKMKYGNSKYFNKEVRQLFDKYLRYYGKNLNRNQIDDYLEVLYDELKYFKTNGNVPKRELHNIIKIFIQTKIP